MFSRLHRIAATSAAAIVLLSTALTGAAQAQSVEWRGTAQFYNFSTACAQNGWSGTGMFNVRSKPSGIGTNGNDSGLGFFMPFYAFGFGRFGGRFDGTWRTLSGSTGSAGQTGSFPNGVWDNPAPRIRITSQTPSVAALTATSPTHRMVGQIQNFSGLAGCTVSFETTMLLRR